MAGLNLAFVAPPNTFEVQADPEVGEDHDEAIMVQQAGCNKQAWLFRGLGLVGLMSIGASVWGLASPSHSDSPSGFTLAFNTFNPAMPTAGHPQVKGMSAQPMTPPAMGAESLMERPAYMPPMPSSPLRSAPPAMMMSSPMMPQMGQSGFLTSSASLVAQSQRVPGPKAGLLDPFRALLGRPSKKKARAEEIQQLQAQYTPGDGNKAKSSLEENLAERQCKDIWPKIIEAFNKYPSHALTKEMLENCWVMQGREVPDITDPLVEEYLSDSKKAEISRRAERWDDDMKLTKARKAKEDVGKYAPRR